MEIDTQRLRIRSFVEADIPTYAAIVADPEVTRYLDDGAPHGHAEAAAYIADVIQRDRDTGIARYAVVRRREGDLLHFCGFRALEDAIDFGWRYARHAWGQGYGTEAALAVLAYGRMERVMIHDRPAVRYYQNAVA